MRRSHALRALAIAIGVSAGIAAHAGQFDLNRAFDAVRGFTQAGTQIDEKQEIAIGRHAAGTILGAAPLVADPRLQSYVNRVGRWIASHSERPHLPWRFGVIDTPGVNAFATPGGYILVTRGLYEALENESQLAGVLGHEIAHVLKRHHIVGMQKKGMLQGLASGAQAFTGSRGNTLLADMGKNLVSEVIVSGLDKSDEFEADHLGVVLAARAGYSPYGLVQVMHKLQARASDPSLGLLFSTHPHPSERLAQLGEAMTPRLAELPAGAEPAIQGVSAAARPARAGAPRAPAGARAMQNESQQSYAPPAAAEPAPAANPLGIDPGSLLRGLIRR